MGWFSTKKSTRQQEVPEEIITQDQAFLAKREGFACYRGEDLLNLPQLSRLVTEIRRALGGDPRVFEKHVLPTMRIFANYAQFIPAADNTEDERFVHHVESLGLLLHSLETALIALNYARNINFTFGEDPNRRAEITTYSYVAVCLAGMLHDMGKIGDFKITTEVVKDGKKQSCEYMFVDSLPEFLAREHGLKLTDVYIKPHDDSRANQIRTSKLPLYRIEGGIPGRGKRHELMANHKMWAMITHSTEVEFAKVSRTLVQDFNTFSYYEQLDNKITGSTPNHLADIVRRADLVSVDLWRKRHHYHPISEEDLMKMGLDKELTEYGDNPSEADYEKRVRKPRVENKEGDGQESGTDAASQSEDNTEEAGSSGIQIKNPLGRIKDSEISSLRVSDSFKEALIKILSERVGSATFTIDQDVGIIFPYGYTDLEGKKELSFFLRLDHKSKPLLIKWFKEASEECRQDVFMENGLDDKALCDYLKILLNLKMVLPANSESKAFQIRPMALWSSKHDHDGLFEAVLLSDNDFLFKTCPEILKTNRDIYLKRNVYFANKDELCIEVDPDFLKRTPDPYKLNRIRREEIAEGTFKPKFGDEKPETENEDGGQTGKTASQSTEGNATGSAGGSQDMPEELKKAAEETDYDELSGEFTEPQIGDLDSAEDLSPDSVMTKDDLKGDQDGPKAPAGFDNALMGASDPLLNWQVKKTPEVFQSKTAEVLKVDDGKTITPAEVFESRMIDPEQQLEIARKVALDSKEQNSDPLASFLQRKHNGEEPTLIGEFSEDITDRENIEKILDLQKHLLLTKEEYLTLSGLEEEKKKELRAELLAKIFEKIPDETVRHKIEVSFEQAREKQLSSFALVTHDRKSCYAAFMWGKPRKMDNHAKSYKEKLKIYNCLPLAPQDGSRLLLNKDNTWYELYYFKCMMLTPYFTKIMALDKCSWEPVEATRTLFHKQGVPPTAWDIVRALQYRLLTVPDEGMFMGKYRVEGSSNYVRTVSENVLYEFCETEFKRLKTPLNSAPQPSKNTFKNILSIVRQDTPPFIWKVRGKDGENKLKISFFPPAQVKVEQYDPEADIEEDAGDSTQSTESPAKAEAVKAVSTTEKPAVKAEAPKKQVNRGKADLQPVKENSVSVAEKPQSIGKPSKEENPNPKAAVAEYTPGDIEFNEPPKTESKPKPRSEKAKPEGKKQSNSNKPKTPRQ